MTNDIAGAVARARKSDFMKSACGDDALESLIQQVERYLESF